MRWKQQNVLDENQGEENACDLKSRGVKKKMFVTSKRKRYFFKCFDK